YWAFLCLTCSEIEPLFMVVRCMKHIPVLHPGGGFAVNRGCPAAFSASGTIQRVTKSPVAILGFFVFNLQRNRTALYGGSMHEAHPCASPWGRLRRESRLSCRAFRLRHHHLINPRCWLQHRGFLLPLS